MLSGGTCQYILLKRYSIHAGLMNPQRESERDKSCEGWIFKLSNSSNHDSSNHVKGGPHVICKDTAIT